MGSGKSKFLVFGGSGLLGTFVVKNLESKSIPYVSTTSKRSLVHHPGLFFEASSMSNLYNTVKDINPDVILNCIGLTNIEYCEKNRIDCKMLNYDLPVQLSEICNSLRIKFIQIGTDHFSTNNPEPRTENNKYFTLNFYAEMKMKAEEEIKNNNDSALLIRTNFFANLVGHPRSLFNWFINKFQIDKPFIGFNDVIFSPISAKILSDNIIELTKCDASGVYNVCGSEVLSKHQFGLLLCGVLGLSPEILVSGSITNFPKMVPRTNYLALDNRMFLTSTGLKIPSLHSMISEEFNYPTKISSK